MRRFIDIVMALNEATTAAGAMVRQWINLLESPASQLNVEEMIDYISHHHGEQLHSDYVEFLKSFSHFELGKIPVAAIRTELPKLDRDKVAQYAKLDSTTAPPIVTYEDNGGYSVLDGYHRASAAKQLNAESIAAYVGREKRG